MCIWSYKKGETGLCVKMGVSGRAYVTDKDENLGKAQSVKEKLLRFALRELFQKGSKNFIVCGYLDLLRPCD